MKGCFLLLYILLLAPIFVQAQQITFSEPLREDDRDMNFDIIGRVKKNILVFKNLRSHYAINIYNDSMELKDKVDLEFLPTKTFNVDYVAYPDFFYLIYEYQKRGILYCMAVKMDPNGQKMSEPVQLDTTSVGSIGDNKIYSAINSEDKKKIMVFKIQRRDEHLHFVTLLFDDQLQLMHKTKSNIEYNDRKDILSEFFLDNDGNLIFNVAYQKTTRESPSAVMLVIKKAMQDTFAFHPLDLNKNYVDEMKMKVDNLNKKYLLSSFYYKEKSTNIQGLLCNIWDAVADTMYAKVFTEFTDELRSMAKSNGSLKSSFNDFFIRSMILKKDGGFILTAEDFSSQSTGSNSWNRYDYLYGAPYLNSYDYYNYNPAYGYYYRPYGSFSQSVRYYYENVLVLKMSPKGMPERSAVIYKQQFSDDSDNYLSFGTFSTAGELHILFNDISKKNKLLSENILTPDGETRRNPTLKTNERDYEFMPRFTKQIGARQVIIPCTYRGQICFAKVIF